MSHSNNPLAIFALSAVVGVASFGAPVMAKETLDTRVVRSAPPVKRTSRERSDRSAEIQAMRLASAETNRTKIVPGSDSVGVPEVAQTLAVATDLYGR